MIDGAAAATGPSSRSRASSSTRRCSRTTPGRAPRRGPACAPGLACETFALVDQIRVDDELVYSLDRTRPRPRREGLRCLRSLLLRGRALRGPLSLPVLSAYSLYLLVSAKSTTTRPARGDGPRGDPEFAMMDLARGADAPRRGGGHGRGRARVRLPRANRDGRISGPGSGGALGLSVRGFGLRVGLSGLSAGLRLRSSGLRAPRRRLGACVSGVKAGG